MLVNKPPMGWNSWNTFGENINEALIKETADAMVETGLRDAGYEYVVIDDCWALKKRDAEGNMVPDPEKFPSGMKALSDYIHSKGLKFGMYSCDGARTCQGYPGSFDYEFIDAQNFADWGVDYLKYDNCFKSDFMPGRILYNRMAMALKSTGRDIVFSACNWGSENVHDWARSAGAHLFRSTVDIFDNYKSFTDIALSQLDRLGSSAPGCFNDPDMLICGMHGQGNSCLDLQGCTDDEYFTHFALWCLYGAPLMIGCDVRNMSDATRKMLLNKDLIAIDQDPEARPPFTVSHYGDTVSMIKHMADGSYTFGFFNLSDNLCGVRCEFFDMGITIASHRGFNFTDIITGEKYENVIQNLSLTIEPHCCRVFRAELVEV